MCFEIFNGELIGVRETELKRKKGLGEGGHFD